MNRLLIPLVALLLTACSSSKNDSSAPPVMSQRMADRIRKPDMNKRSIYDTAMQSSITKSKGDVGGRFLNQKHHTKSFTGSKSYGRTPDFKTSEFGGAKERNRMAGQSFQGSRKQSRDANSNFDTHRSRLEGQTSRDAGKSFADNNRVFETRANRDALKSQQKNEGPRFIELEENHRKPAYTEDQVRKLLGRN
jgi:hypothetical protein